jgi:hypothetical protein
MQHCRFKPGQPDIDSGDDNHVAIELEIKKEKGCKNETSCFLTLCSQWILFIDLHGRALEVTLMDRGWGLHCQMIVEMLGQR